MGYKFQFVTLGRFPRAKLCHVPARAWLHDRGMSAYAELQEAEFSAEADGYTATKHQREVGAGYFDEVAQVIAGRKSSTTALEGSTEQEQFH